MSPLLHTWHYYLVSLASWRFWASFLMSVPCYLPWISNHQILLAAHLMKSTRICLLVFPFTVNFSVWASRLNNLSLPQWAMQDILPSLCTCCYSRIGKIQPIPTINFCITSHTLPKSGQVPLLMYFHSTLYFPHCHIFYGKYPFNLLLYPIRK